MILKINSNKTIHTRAHTHTESFVWTENRSEYIIVNFLLYFYYIYLKSTVQSR